MNEDQLISCLSDLCQRFAQDALEGRYEVARQAGLSEQYLYQILTGKPMVNGNKRSVGKIARAKLSKAFPDWLNKLNDQQSVSGHKSGSPTWPFSALFKDWEQLPNESKKALDVIVTGFILGTKSPLNPPIETITVAGKPPALPKKHKTTKT